MPRRASSQAAPRAHGPRLNRVYAAIADPTRRAILAVLAGGELNVGSLAGRFPITFNGVSKHVKVLERAGLVRRRARGRGAAPARRSEEHTSELQSLAYLVCRLLLEKKKNKQSM